MIECTCKCQVSIITTCVRHQDLLLSSRRPDSSQGVFGRGAEEIEDLVELIDVILTLEDGFTAEQFSENTPDGPHVNYAGSADGVLKGGSGHVLDSV